MTRMISLWTFACKLYSDSLVKNACLTLQDNCAVNVPLLLTCCWASHRFQPIAPNTAAALQQCAAQWEGGCIQPLRQLRREMKGKPFTADDDGVAWSYAREQIKEIELSAEQSLLQTLERSMLQECIELDVGIKTGYFNEDGKPAASLWVDRLLSDIHQCFPHIRQLTGTAKGMAHGAIAQIVLAVIHAGHPQIQYDALLIHVNGYRL